MNPDLDQASKSTYGERALLRLWRPLGRAWGIYWELYSEVVPHRSPVSHLPVFGTFLRFVYLGWWAGCLVGLAWLLTGWTPPPSWWPFLLEVFTGVVLSDTLHWVMDGAPTEAVHY
jgi:uncharacterized metal-binding protein